MARKRMEGNGESKTTINTIQRRPDWVTIAVVDVKSLSEKTGIFVNLSVERWILDHPTVQIRASVGIVHGGRPAPSISGMTKLLSKAITMTPLTN